MLDIISLGLHFSTILHQQTHHEAIVFCWTQGFFPQEIQKCNSVEHFLGMHEWSTHVSFFCFYLALHSEQWSQAVWHLCFDRGLWLRWHPQVVPDGPLRDIPCLEGQWSGPLLTVLLLAILSYVQWCLEKPGLIARFFFPGKRHRPQCKDCEGVLGKELHRRSHRWWQWDHQAGNQSFAWGKVKKKRHQQEYYTAWIFRMGYF